MNPCEVHCRDGSDKADYYLESLIIFESSAVAGGAIYRSDSEQSHSQIGECIHVGAGHIGEAEIELIAISDALIQQQSLYAVEGPVLGEAQFFKLIKPGKSAHISDVVVLEAENLQCVESP